MKITSLNETIAQLEHQVRMASNNESGYAELQQNFQNVCLANNEMKIKIEELNQEIKKRDQIARDWNDTLESIDAKIVSLESENAELKKEREQLLSDNQKLKRLLDESDQMNSILQEKCDYIERLTTQLEQENRAIETLKFVQYLIYLLISRKMNNSSMKFQDKKDKLK